MDHQKIFDNASEALKLAFSLNDCPVLDGQPCRDAFTLAKSILSKQFGARIAEKVVDDAVSASEYSSDDLRRYFEARQSESQAAANIIVDTLMSSFEDAVAFAIDLRLRYPHVAVQHHDVETSIYEGDTIEAVINRWQGVADHFRSKKSVMRNSRSRYAHDLRDAGFSSASWTYEDEPMAIAMSCEDAEKILNRHRGRFDLPAHRFEKLAAAVLGERPGLDLHADDVLDLCLERLKGRADRKPKAMGSEEDSMMTSTVSKIRIKPEKRQGYLEEWDDFYGDEDVRAELVVKGRRGGYYVVQHPRWESYGTAQVHELDVDIVE